MGGKKLVDRTGKRYGKLTALYISSTNPIKWHCRCDCGNECDVISYNLPNGNTKSCGCEQKKIASKTHKIHGMKNTRLYYIWIGMKERCTNPKNKRYNRYGGRGIKICEEWKNDFIAFYKWAKDNGYKDELTIDRINVDGNYEPNNCRWASWKEQANNTSNNLVYELNGETHTLAEWSEIYAMKYQTVRTRIRQLGWSLEEALTTPIRGVRHK